MQDIITVGIKFGYSVSRAEQVLRWLKMESRNSLKIEL